jgi:hypothetical protein
MRHDIRVLALAALFLGQGTAAAQAQGAGGDEWAAIDRAIGRPGKSQAGEVQKYSFPRGDLQVSIGDIEVKPALALGSWVAFKHTGQHGRDNGNG